MTALTETEAAPRADIDWITSEDLYRDPYPAWRRLRNEAPVAWVPWINAWLISKRADMEALYERTDLITAEAPGNPVNDSLGAPNILMAEGPEHADLRGSINEVMLPRTVDTYVDSMLAPIVQQRLSMLPASGRVDLHHDYFEPVSVLGLGALIGLGHVSYEKLLYWFHDLAEGAFNFEKDPVKAAKCAVARADFEAHLDELFDKLEHEPDGSLISEMMHHGMPPGQVRPREYIVPSLHVILVGGAQEPGHSAGMLFHGLFSHPEQLADLKADIEGTLPRAINEALRWQPPLGTIERVAVTDFEWRGQQIKTGEMVIFLPGAVNRDEDYYSDPEAFNIHRTEGTHRAFGMGRHMCMGHWFARRQMQMSIKSLLHAYPDLAPVPGDVGELTGWSARGPKSLPADLGERAAEYVVEPVVDPASHAPRTLTVRVEAVSQVATDVMSLTFVPVGSDELPAWTPGAHVDVHVADGLIRQYSLCGDPADRGRYRIAVRREETGRGGSRHIHERVKPGDLLEVGRPRNRFELQPCSGSLLFIAGGIGITPMLPMLRHAHEAGLDWTMLYAGRSRAHLAFADEMEAYGDRVTFWESDVRGLPDLKALMAGLADGSMVYCCGPAPLLDAVRAAAPAGVEVRTELFVPAARQQAPDTEFELELEGTGLTTTVPVGQSILTAIEKLGVYVPSGCTVGVCGSCVTEVVSGDLDHRDAVLDPSEQESGERMAICVSRCTSKRLVLRPPSL